MARKGNEALSMAISGAGMLGFFSAMLPVLVSGPLGFFFVVITLISSFLAFMVERTVFGLIRVLGGVGVAFTLLYVLGSMPSNPVAQQVLSEQSAGMVTSLGKSIATSVAVATPTSAPAVTAGTIMSPTPIAVAATKQSSIAVPPLVPTSAASVLTAIVFHGGNLRESVVDGRVLDQINAHEQVQLLKKNQPSTWYFIINERNIRGWVSKTLLQIADDTDRQISVGEE